MGRAFVSNLGWWGHNLVVLTFLNLLPLSKHFHIITSMPNVFFKKLEPKGALGKQDLENATTFGTSYINQFTWKQVLDMYSCTECGRCSSNCPATIQRQAAGPRQLLINLRDYLYEHEDAADGGQAERRGDAEAASRSARTSSASSLIHDEVLWACTTCRACEEACPVMIEYVDKIVDMRRHLVQEESRFPAELTRTFKGMETQSNPWGIDARSAPTGPRGSTSPRSPTSPTPSISTSSAAPAPSTNATSGLRAPSPRSCKQAGVDFAILGRRSPATARRPAASATSTCSRPWRR